MHDILPAVKEASKAFVKIIAMALAIWTPGWLMTWGAVSAKRHFQIEALADWEVAMFVMVLWILFCALVFVNVAHGNMRKKNKPIDLS